MLEYERHCGSAPCEAPKSEGESRRVNLRMQVVLTHNGHAAVIHILRPVTASAAEGHSSYVPHGRRGLRNANSSLPWQMLARGIASCACSDVFDLYASTTLRQAQKRTFGARSNRITITVSRHASQMCCVHHEVLSSASRAAAP